jgi:putative chitinase
MNIQNLKGHVPDNVLTMLPEVIDKAQINTPLRMAHFLAQTGHESGNFKILQENLMYSDPNRIVQIFKFDFDQNKNRVIEQAELEKAKSLVKKAKELANFVYANQNGNGNEASGDGYNYRGRGYIQLTGRANYKSFSDFIGENCVANPDLVATKYPLASAAWFFSSKNLNKIADKGATKEVVTEITKRVNGGTIGLEDRIRHFNHYYKLLNTNLIA